MLLLPVYLPVGFYPTQPYGLVLTKVLGFAEEQAGNTQVCEAAPCRDRWMMNDDVVGATAGILRSAT